MLRNIPVSNSLFLVQQTIDAIVTSIEKDQPTHEVIIIDGSGSIYSVHNRMIQDVIARIDRAAPETIMSVAWFSSVGQRGYIFSGMHVGQQREQMKTILENHRPTYNLTCFSEILEDTEQLVQNFKPVSDKFGLLFLTDGNDNQHQDRVRETSERLAPHFRVVKILGYGDWYSPDRIRKMAEWLGGGSFAHVDNLDGWREQLTAFGTAAGSAESKIEIALDVSDPLFGFAFTLTNRAVEVLDDEALGNWHLRVSKSTRAVYFLSDKPIGVSQAEPDGNFPEAALYGAAKALMQRDRPADAKDVLSFLGDINFVQRVDAAFTVAEMGLVETTIGRAVYDASHRYLKGQKRGCVAARDQFCLMQLLDMLIADPDVCFLPYHPAFRYKKIGRGQKQLPGYPEFKAAQNVKVPFSTVKWSNGALNASVLAKIPGTIQLTEEAMKYKLDQIFETYLWRNFALIANGVPNVLLLPLCDASESIMTVLEANNLIQFESENGTVIIDISPEKLPVINRAIAEGYRDLHALCELVKQENELEAEQKVLGYLFNQLPEALKERVSNLVYSVPYSDEQMRYLAGLGVQKDLSYKPPSEKLDATDVLYVTEIEFGIKGVSSLPKVEEVLEKLKEGKDLTLRQEMISTAYKTVIAETQYGPVKMGDVAGFVTPIQQLATEAQKALTWKERQKQNRGMLTKLREQINRARMALALAKVPFDQLQKLGDKTPYELDGITYIISIKRDVEVPV